MPRYLAVQFSDRLLNPVNPGRAYYSRVYGRIPGWVQASEDFMELPAWVARLAGVVPELEVQVIRTTDELLQVATGLRRTDTVYFSLLDCTADYAGDFTALTRARVVVGGYVTGRRVPPGSKWFNSLEQYARWAGREDGGWDWSIFKGHPCVFRVRLSTGCRHNCVFCTVPRDVVQVDPDQLLGSLRGCDTLRFERVYLDDKTYGQADPECRYLGALSHELMYRTGSKPLVTVQTTAAQICGGGKNFIGGMWRHGVDMVEIGMEILHDPTLRKLRKPHTVEMFKNAVKALREWRIKVVPYILLGLPGCGTEEYTGTLEWLRGAYGAGYMPFAHFNWLTPYPTSKGADLLPEASGLGENGGRRPWLTARQQEEQEQVAREIETITGD